MPQVIVAKHKYGLVLELDDTGKYRVIRSVGLLGRSSAGPSQRRQLDAL